jgi:hypothetical protein
MARPGAVLRLPDYGAIAAAKPLFVGVLPTSAVIGDTIGGALSQFSNTVADNQAQKQSMLQFADTIQNTDPDTANMIRAAASSVNPFSKDATGHTGMMMQLMMENIREKNREKHDLALQNLILGREQIRDTANHAFQLNMLQKEEELKEDFFKHTEPIKEELMDYAARIKEQQEKDKFFNRWQTQQVTEEGKNVRQDKDLAQKLEIVNKNLEEKRQENERKAAKDAADAAMKKATAKIPEARITDFIGKTPDLNAQYAKAWKDAMNTSDKDIARSGSAAVKRIREEAAGRMVRLDPNAADAPLTQDPSRYFIPKGLHTDPSGLQGVPNTDSRFNIDSNTMLLPPPSINQKFNPEE